MLAWIWFEGWHDAHAGIIPDQVVRLRTFESFRQRLPHVLPELRTAGAGGRPMGFAIVNDDELDQLYVGRPARGTGLAARLVTDALHRIRRKGHMRAWLACGIGNERAARFYETNGWRRDGVVRHKLETTEGIFELDVWRYEFDLRAE